MEIVVTIKPVPEGESRLRPNSAGTALDPEGIKWVLAGYDESAVEQAILLKESVPGSRVHAVAFGPAPRTEEVLRYALSLGSDTATWVERPRDLAADAILAARAIAPVVRRLAPQLVLTGKHAGDDEAGLFGAALAELLDLPDAGCVVNLRVDASGGGFTFERAIEGGLEKATAPAPLVVGLQQAWSDPRTPKLPNILKSRKAPIERVPWTDTSTALADASTPALRPVGFALPAARTGARMIDYATPKEAADKLVRLLREEAKVFP
ncbi:MAG: electron transfer flavoprotein subunit beta/FixA family protein [Thermoplasmata archaeon]